MPQASRPATMLPNCPPGAVLWCPRQHPSSTPRLSGSMPPRREPRRCPEKRPGSQGSSRRSACSGSAWRSSFFELNLKSDSLFLCFSASLFLSLSLCPSWAINCQDHRYQLPAQFLAPGFDTALTKRYNLTRMTTPLPHEIPDPFCR